MELKKELQGGEENEESEDMPEDELEKAVRKSLRNILGYSRRTYIDRRERSRGIIPTIEPISRVRRRRSRVSSRRSSARHSRRKRRI